MKNKKNNEGLQSRREFFKEAAKRALPFLAATVLANTPVIAKALETPSDCNGGCYNSCNNGCLSSCEGDCWGSCSGNCKGDCLGSCKKTCDGSCSGNCGSSSYY